MEKHGSLLAEPRFWVAIAVVIFALLFGRKLWSALAALLDKRTEAVRLELAEASRLRHEAEAMLKDAAAARAAALQQAEALLHSAKAEALRVAEAAEQEAALAAQRRERMALDRISAAEHAATREVRDAAVAVAVQAVRDVLLHNLPSSSETALVDHAIAGLPGMLAGKRAA